MCKLFVVTFVLLLLFILLIAAVSFVVFLPKETQKPFYVGVTYCGGSIHEAKELVDRVKGYTNLFVLQSGPFMWNIEAMDEIGDYVVASNLSYVVCNSVHESVGLRNQVLGNWLIDAKERWGEQFLGVYFGDEPGGDMLDGKPLDLDLKPFRQINGTISRFPTISKEKGTIYVNNEHNHWGDRSLLSQIICYSDNGEILLFNYFNEGEESLMELLSYYPNGTVTITESTDWENYIFYTTEHNITLYSWPLPSYEQVLKPKPMQTIDEAAKVFVNMHKQNLVSINKTQLAKKDISVFTADYGLYWWDYRGGYDVVFAELAWNHSVVQHMGLVRGAANLQGKNWGTILTWKYTQTPFLAEGEEMFEHMKMSYEAGAEYVLIFNYSEDPKNPNTLQEEHFLALERFWKEIVQNPQVVHGGIKAEAVLVLPKNYGWGMRIPTDTIWGLWDADETCQELWTLLQEKIDQHGLKLDIVFDDPNYPAWNYNQIYYWNKK